MTRSRLGLYSDLPPILDAIIAAGGGTYALQSPGDAIHWRQRVYKFRKAFQQETGSARYDQLILARPAGNLVEVSLRRAAGIFTPATPRAAGDKYEDEAFGLAARILKGVPDAE